MKGNGANEGVHTLESTGGRGWWHRDRVTERAKSGVSKRRELTDCQWGAKEGRQSRAIIAVIGVLLLSLDRRWYTGLPAEIALGSLETRLARLGMGPGRGADWPPTLALDI
jgi:hypothetical protein